MFDSGNWFSSLKRQFMPGTILPVRGSRIGVVRAFGKPAGAGTSALAFLSSVNRSRPVAASNGALMSGDILPSTVLESVSLSVLSQLVLPVARSRCGNGMFPMSWVGIFGLIDRG